MFVPLRPGTDAAFLNGVLHVIERDGLLDETYIADHTVGWEAVRDIVRTYPPDRVAGICGIDPSFVERVGAMWGGAERAMAFHARGIEHQRLGVENALAVINLVLATGQLGAEGKGWHDHWSGQRPGRARARAEGGPAPGGPRHRGSGAPGVHRGVLGDPRGRSSACRDLRGRARARREGNVKGLLALCNNPLVSMPNVDRIVADYDALEFHVQLDFFLSETSERADVVLPSAVWAEDAGVTTNAEEGSSCAIGPRTRRGRQGRTGGSCPRSPAGSDTPSGSPSTPSRTSSRSFEERAPVASPTTRG